MRMTSLTAGLFAISVIAGAPAIAQTQLTAQTPADAHKTKTVTGCLEASASLPGFRLKDAEFDAGATPAPVGTSGKALEYEVTAKEGVDLSAHAGQKVTAIVTEEVEADEKVSSSLAGEKGPMPKLTILSLKTVAVSCGSR